METSLVEQSTQMHSHYTESGLVGAVQLNGVILVSEEVETNFFALGFVMFLELYFEDEFEIYFCAEEGPIGISPLTFVV